MAGSSVVKQLEQEADECYQSILLPINERMMGPLPQVCTLPTRPHARTTPEARRRLRCPSAGRAR